MLTWCHDDNDPNEPNDPNDPNVSNEPNDPNEPIDQSDLNVGWRRMLGGGETGAATYISLPLLEWEKPAEVSLSQKQTSRQI